MGKGLEIARQCNIRYHSVGKTTRSAMPIGNGEVGSSVWTNEKGNLEFYISRTDALSEVERTLKVGKVRIELSPNPFLEEDFVQELRLEEGAIVLSSGKGSCTVFVGKSSDTIYVTGEFQQETEINVVYENWRTEPFYFANEFAKEIIPESVDYVKEIAEGVLFYHKNEKTLVEETAENQSLLEELDIIPDMLTGRIFGGMVVGAGSYKGTSLDVRVHTRSAQESEESFIKRVQEMVAVSVDVAKEKEAVREKWSAFWEKSYIKVEEKQATKPLMTEELLACATEPREYECSCDSAITRGYTLTKYMQACCSEGNFPMFYNGLLFQQEPARGKHFGIMEFWESFTGEPGELSMECNPDERSWSREHLWQNLRLPYFTQLAVGEHQSVRKMFQYYRRFWDVNRIRAKKYYNAEGQHNTEMTLTSGLQSVGIYGRDRTNMRIGYADNRWGGAVDISPGLELTYLMLDYYEFTKDDTFLKEEVLVYAKDLCRYVETRFLNRMNGKIVIGPLQSIETYWDTLNPVTVVSGLQAVVTRILKISEDLNPEYTYFQGFEKMIPVLPKGVENEKEILQPAMAYAEERHNVEPPEYYSMFPFDLVKLGKLDKELALHTFHERTKTCNIMKPFVLGSVPSTPSYSGWQYVGIVAARLGLTDVCKEILSYNCSISNPGYRFPAMWGPIYDSVPDVDHGANIMNLLHEMIFQKNGVEVELLQAFPKDWKVEFRLFVDQNTVIEGNEQDYKKVAV